ncbi:META domain-containing protein [Chloroflexi bacterium TSY]|nr:META domain-containing protein [Chloroflexi bacterium TSY]
MKTESVASESPTEDSKVIQGKTWYLRSIETQDGQRVMPDDPTRYTIELMNDDTLAVLADCNQGMGAYESTTSMNDVETISGEITFQIGFTRMRCRPESLFDWFSEGLNLAERFVIDAEEKDELVVVYDGGTMTFSLAAPGHSGLGDEFYPELGNGGYDVVHYTIELTVDIEQNFISGQTTVDAEATQNLDQFNLDLSGLEVTSVQVNGVEADISRHGIELVITPSEPIVEGQLFKTIVSYHGTPEPLDDPGVPFFRVGWQKQPGGIFAVSEPSGSMNWYPVNNHPQDKATYTFRITVPQPFVVAANGVLTEQLENENAITYIWMLDDPMASYLATIHIGDYELVEETGPDGLLIRNYFPKGTSESIKEQFGPTAEMIAFMNEMIGPYPYDTYGVILLTKNVGWALETQTLSTFSASGSAEGVIFHELMHQWFGNSVSPENWRDVWLNEGFATYFQQLWTEHKRGTTTFNQTMDGMYSHIVRQKMAPPASVEVADLFSQTVYVRGAWTLHALRLTVGDDTFFEILRTFYKQHEHGIASTQDFIDLVVELGGEEVRGVLHAWLYDETVPDRP